MPGQITVASQKGHPHEATNLGRAAGVGGTVDGATETITLDLSTGHLFVINCTTTDAFTVANPVSGYAGQEFEITYKNTSGGTMGTPTFGNAFKVGTFTKPATTKQRTLRYRYDGTNFVQLTDASDVAN
jgi:hypothetical protein